MLRFIRRLFILLIIFTVVFLVYRYINPLWASRLVDKIKSVPDRISSFFQSEKKDDIKVEWKTTIISGDINLLDDNSEVNVEINQDDSEDEDLSWLQELNNEIDIILWKEKTWEVLVNQENNVNKSIEIEEENTWDIVDTWDNKTIDDIVEDESDEEEDSEIEETSAIIIWGDCGEGLTQKECDEIKNLGNIIE